MEEIDALLSDCQTLGIGKGDSSKMKIGLKAAQLAVDDAIALEKSAWSVHQAEKIHSMRFNPKEVWESVCVLSGVDTSNNDLPTIMQMRLPNWELENTDAENSSVFGPHFHRFFNNHRPIDWPMLDKIKQREVMYKLDHPISWDEIKKATTKLANEKAPGLNGVPPNAFKALDDANLSWLLLFYNQFWHSQDEFYKWNEGQVVTVPKKGNTYDPNKWRGGNPNGHRQQDLQQYHVWTTIQDNQQTRREMPIWIHTWSWMPRWHIHNQDTSTYKTQPQPSNMGGIHRPSQGLKHL